MFFPIKKILASIVIVYTVLLALMLVFWQMDGAIAAQIDPVTRTVPLNTSGESVTLTMKQLAIGQRKFNSSCSQCHIDGMSKTNPDVDLGPQTLAAATPERNSIEGIVDYLHEPTTYDGLRSLAELHPSTLKSDLFPRMRNLTDEDLTAIAGYILTQPAIVGEQWSGGKPKR